MAAIEHPAPRFLPDPRTQTLEEEHPGQIVEIFNAL
jgi:hypothetical protein